MTFRSGILGATLTSALALGVASANAADIYRGEPAGGSLKDAPIVAPVSSWAGFYIGGHLGAAFDDDDASLKVENTRYKFGDDDEELIGGVHVGYNFQRYGSPLVLGIEGDISFADNIDWLSTIRARIGYATDRTLFYLTGGVAFADFEEDKWSGWKFGDDDTEVGYVLGGGAEFKLTHNWSFGLEGLYYNFDDNDEDGFLDGRGSYEYENEHDFWVARARLTYHINRDHVPLDTYK